LPSYVEFSSSVTCFFAFSEDIISRIFQVDCLKNSILVERGPCCWI